MTAQDAADGGAHADDATADVETRTSRAAAHLRGLVRQPRRQRNSWASHPSATLRRARPGAPHRPGSEPHQRTDEGRRLWAMQGDQYAADVVLRSPDPQDPRVIEQRHLKRLRYKNSVSSTSYLRWCGCSPRHRAPTKHSTTSRRCSTLMRRTSWWDWPVSTSSPSRVGDGAAARHARRTRGLTS